MIVARNLPVTLPTEEDTTIPTLHLVTTFALFDGGGALWTISRHPLQMSQSQEFGLRFLPIFTTSAGTLLQCLYLIANICTFGAWMENATAFSTENEEAYFAFCHVILVFDARHMFTVCIAPRAENYVVHGIKASAQA